MLKGANPGFGVAAERGGGQLTMGPKFDFEKGNLKKKTIARAAQN